MVENEINIFYQYNSKAEINKKIINDSYFLIEHERRRDFKYDTIETLLINDGVDLEKICTIYIDENPNHSPIILKPFSKGNFDNYKDRENIYLHLELEDTVVNTQKSELKSKIKMYNSSIAD